MKSAPAPKSMTDCNFSRTPGWPASHCRRPFAFVNGLCLIPLITLLAVGRAVAAAPYPYSTYVTNIVFNFNTATTYCKKYGTDGGDIWCYTWAADDKVYTAYGDGFGFFAPQTGKCSWGISTIAGPFQSFSFADIYYYPAGSKHGKIASVLAISNVAVNVLYAMNDIQDVPDGNSTNTALMSSSNNGVSWVTNAMFSHLSEFHGGFIQNGKNYSGNSDGYVYLYGGNARLPGTYMARVPIGSVTNKAQYQYLTNIDAGNQAHWGYLSNAIPIFNDPNGWGGGADYDAALGRWLMSGAPYPGDGGCLSLYEGPTMWGPWKTITYQTNWANLGNYSNNGNAQIEDFGFPQKYMTPDGLTLGMFASVYGTTNTLWNDTLLTMTVTLGVASGSTPPPPAPIGLVAVRDAAYPSMQVDVSWNNVTNATSYQLLRSTANGGPYASLAYTATGNTNYTDTAVTPGTAYYYVITASNPGGLSANSAQAYVTLRTNAAPTLDSIANLTLSMNASPQTVNLTGIGPGANETSQILSVSASSGNTALIPNPAVTYTNPNSAGTLNFTPVANGSGTTYVTVKIQDNGGTNGGGVDTLTRTFSITIISNPPSLHDYRSVASGNWNTLATWQMFNGTNWVTPGSAPNSYSGLTTIQSPHVITNAGSVTVSHVVVNSGAQLIVNQGSSFTVTTSSVGTNLDVFGTIKNAGTVSGSGMVLFEPGSRYFHNQDGGAVPTANWAAGSTCLITGITNAAALSGLGQAFYNFSWNCPNQAVRFDAAGALTNIQGSFSAAAAASTDPSTLGGHGLALSLSSGQTLTIGGDLNLTNAYLIPAGNASGQGSGVQVNLGGNINTDGKYTGIYTDYTGNDRRLFGIISFTNTVAGSRITQGPSANAAWDGSQAYSYRLAAGVTLHVGTNSARVWNFTNCPGSTLVIANMDGIETGDDHGAFQAQQEFWKGGTQAARFPNPATNYFEPNATYVYEGSAAQVTGAGLPATVANLTINNPTVVSVSTRSGDVPYPLTPAFLTAVTNMLCVVNGTLDLGRSNLTTVSALSGFGAITNGNVRLANTGSGLLPGEASVAGILTLDGTLTFGASSKATFELSDDPENGANDEVVSVGAGTVAGNGSVITVHPMGLMSQNDYVLFDIQGSGQVVSSFNPLPAWLGTPPANAGNYRIVTSGNQVLLRYASTPQPVLAAPVVSGTNLLLTSGGGTAGATYGLFTSTNAMLPLAGWTLVLTNTFGADGSFSNVVPISASDTRRFYILGPR
jgi:hypothetical protein